MKIFVVSEEGKMFNIIVARKMNANVEILIFSYVEGILETIVGEQ